MMTKLATLAATTLLASAAFAATIGAPAPAFKGTDVITGKEVSNDTLKGKIAVLEWNNFGCPFVKKFYGAGEMQRLQAAAKKDGVVWVSVNSSAAGKEGHLKDAAEAKAAIAEHKLGSSHYLLDHSGAIGKAFGAKTTPHMFVIAADGTLAYQGAIDSDNSPDPEAIKGATNHVTAALAELKAGKPVTVSSTQPYGCFVKY